MESRLICFALLVHLSVQVVGQLSMTPSSHDFGLLRVSDPNWVDVKLTNLGQEDAVIFRVECSDNFVVQMSSKKVLRDSSSYIRLQYNPTQKGPFREVLKIFAG